MKDLGDLQVFAKVVSTRSMSSAARSLGLSPAVVSKRIRRLEDSLGIRLLQRTTRQVAVTEVGQGYYERAIHIIDSIEEAQRFVSGKTSEINGTLRISAPTSFGRMHMAPHLPQFMQAYPQLSIDLMLSDTFTDVIAEGYDLAVRISEPKDSGLVSRKLAEVRRILCAAPAYLSTFGLPKTIADLEHHQCLPSHNGESWRLDGPSGPFVYRPNGRLNTNSSEVIRESVIAGLGIALRSTWDVGPEIRAGKLMQVLPGYRGSRDVTISALYPSRQFLPGKVRVFIDFLNQLYGPTPYWDAVEATSNLPDELST